VPAPSLIRRNQNTRRINLKGQELEGVTPERFSRSVPGFHSFAPRSRRRVCHGLTRKAVSRLFRMPNSILFRTGGRMPLAKSRLKRHINGLFIVIAAMNHASITLGVLDRIHRVIALVGNGMEISASNNRENQELLYGRVFESLNRNRTSSSIIAGNAWFLRE